MENLTKKMDFFIMKEEFIFFRPLSISETLPLCMEMAGISYCDANYRVERDSECSTFVFEYVESGRGTLTVEDQVFHPQAGDVYIAPGWKQHTYFADPKDPFVKHWFNLSGGLVEELLSLYKIQNVYLFTKCETGGKIILDTLAGLRGVKQNEFQEFMSVQVLKLIIALARHAKQSGSVREPNPLAYKLHAFLSAHVFRPAPTLDEICAQIRRSSVQTIRIFRSEFDVTPHCYLMDMKINAAAELLIGTNQSIKHVSSVLGFDDEYYFARLFKKHRGVSPGKFRKAAQRMRKRYFPTLT